MKILFYLSKPKRLLLVPVCLLFLLHLSLLSTAQENNSTVSGQVLSETNEPIPGVNILVKESNIGTVTDADGRFSITAKSNSTLVFSFIGYTTVERAVNNQTEINVNMEPDIRTLSEVVVVGYGTQKKSHLTGAVGKVKNERLNEIPAARTEQLISGRIAGVQVQNTNGAAGAEPRIQIRGVNTITAGQKPLLVVDGYPIPGGDLNSINMADIESIEVLKDASSAGIYGSRGGNGVIIITTKKGTEGAPVIDLNVFGGPSWAYEKHRVIASPAEWTSYVNNNLTGFGLAETPVQIREMNNLGTSTDWVDEVLRNGSFQNYQLNISGGNSSLRYFVSGAYLKEKSPLITNEYEKYNLRVNIDAKLSKRLEMGVSLNPSLSNQRDFPLSFHDAVRSVPWLPTHVNEANIGYIRAAGFNTVELGEYAQDRYFKNVNGVDLTLSNDNNPLSRIYGQENTLRRTLGYFNSYFKYKIAEGLHFKTTAGVFTNYSQDNGFVKSYSNRNLQTSATYQNGNTLDWLNENLLTYDKRSGEHNFAFLGGFTMQKTVSEGAQISANGFLTDYIPTLNAAAAISGASTTRSENSLVSALFRMNYDYKDRYLLSVVSRWDASSRFGPNNRWASFPSVSLGWRLSEEGFMTDVETVSDLKLRLSFGTSGNNQIPNYGAISTLSPIGAVFGTGAGSTVPGFAQGNIENPDLGWERTRVYDAGVDLGLFDNRLTVSMDYYINRTDQLLLELQIPAVTGFSSMLQNRGKVENKGFEVELGSTVIARNRFNWKVDANFSMVRNTLVDFGGVDEVVTVPDDKRPSYYVSRVNNPLVQFYGYVVDREIQQEQLTTPYWPVGVKAERIFVKDINGDGAITPADRVVLGSPYPDFIFGFGNTVTYGNFDLNFLIQGSRGGKVYNVDSYYYETNWKGKENLTDAERAGTRLKTETDYNLQDASYICLRNISLGYSLPLSATENISAKKLRIYISGSNLWYNWSKSYTGFNPEGFNTFNSNPLVKNYQRGSVPVSASVTAGLNLTF